MEKIRNLKDQFEKIACMVSVKEFRRWKTRGYC